MVASAFGGIVPIPYASSFNAHTINHAVATPLIASAPLPVPATFSAPLPVPAALSAHPIPAALGPHPVPATFGAPLPLAAPIGPVISPYAAHQAFGYSHLRYPHPYLF